MKQKESKAYCTLLYSILSIAFDLYWQWYSYSITLSPISPWRRNKNMTKQTNNVDEAEIKTAKHNIYRSALISTIHLTIFIFSPNKVNLSISVHMEKKWKRTKDGPSDGPSKKPILEWTRASAFIVRSVLFSFMIGVRYFMLNFIILRSFIFPMNTLDCRLRL